MFRILFQKLILITLLVICSFTLFAQDTISYWYETFYHEKENIEIPSLQYKLVNQEAVDMMLSEYTEEDWFNISETGMPQLANIPVIKVAKKVKRGDITNYLLHVKAVDMRTAALTLNLDIPEGVIVLNEPTNGSLRQKFNYNNNSSNYPNGINILSNSNEFILKVIVPKGTKKRPTIIISKFHYYTNPFWEKKKKEKSLSSI